jgi:hypothetical protein
VSSPPETVTEHSTVQISNTNATPQSQTSSGSNGTSVSQISPAVSSEAPSSSSVQAAPAASPASDTVTSVHRNESGPIAGGVVGGVLVLLILFGLFLCYRRRRQAAKHVRSGNGLITEPFMLEVPASPQSPLTPGSSMGVPYMAPRGPLDSPIPVDPRGGPTPSLVSGTSASATSAIPLTRSATAIKRQMRLREQEEEHSRQMADLEARTRDSSQWVSRAEYETELGRLRAEVEWLRDTQQSDWAMGLSDEMPPAYQRNSAMNSQHGHSFA